MKVILNVDAISQPLTGIGRYTLQLARQVKRQEAVTELRCFSASHWVEPETLGQDSNPWLSRLRQWVPFKGLALRAYARRRDRCFQQLAGGLTDHVFHSPNFVLMPFAGRSVATFHDLSFVHHRETQPGYRLKFLDQAIPRTLEQADALLTPSAHVKQEITAHYGYPAERIHVTPLGVEPGFKPRDEAATQSTLDAWGLRHKHYVLAVATTEPRKNLPRLLKAYSLLPDAMRQRYPLVLAGAKGWLNQDLNRQLKNLLNAGQIICPGYLPESQLHTLYSGAALTALPSLYEGFGLPIIESMASGTPVLTSAHSAMQEVAAGHALLCNPLDTENISNTLQQALDDPSWQQQASQNGLQHAQKFTWQRCAAMTINAYQK